VAGAAALWLLLVAGGGPSLAQSAAAATAAASNPQYQALFKRMYADPSNLDVTFQFAELATQLGDYEAAIGALERMLFYNPNLPRVKLELGVLYFRMGGYQVARSYFEQAVATPGAPPEVQATVNQYLAEIDKGVSPQKFNVSIYAGWRYQSNANAGPSSLLIRALGQDAVLNDQFGKVADWNKFVTAGMTYSYDLTANIALEASLLGYYAKQDKLSQFDLGLAELQVGPRFATPAWLLPSGSIKFYGIGTTSYLAEHPYFNAGGAGVSMRFAIPGWARFEPSFEFRSRDFDDSIIYPTASQQTSDLSTLAMTADGIFAGFLPWSARVAADWNRAKHLEDNFNSYDRLSVDIGFPIPFALTWAGTLHPFVFTPSAGASRTDYAEPSFIIDPEIVRKDREWHVAASLDAQIYGTFGLRTLVQYSQTSSSLPNFDMKNLSVSVGPTLRF
jgi:hypothetical protein